jgi:hypothetical protein
VVNEYVGGNQVYDTDGYNKYVWSAGHVVPNPSHCILQLDGNFVCYDTHGTAYWDTQTAGVADPVYKLAIQPDCNLVLSGYRQGVRVPVWASNSVR